MCVILLLTNKKEKDNYGKEICKGFKTVNRKDFE